MRAPCLPPSYRLDESDLDVPVLCREDGTVVAHFRVRGRPGGAIEEAAWDDHKGHSGYYKAVRRK